MRHWKVTSPSLHTSRFSVILRPEKGASIQNTKKGFHHCAYGTPWIGYWVDPPNYFDDVVWPNYLLYNSPFVEITNAMEAGKATGIYNASNTSRTDPMIQGVDIISSGDSSIHSMVKTVSDGVANRLSELHSRSSWS